MAPNQCGVRVSNSAAGWGPSTRSESVYGLFCVPSRGPGNPRSKKCSQSGWRFQSAPKVRHKGPFRGSTVSVRIASVQVRPGFCQQSNAFDVVRHREELEGAKLIEPVSLAEQTGRIAG